MLAGDLDAAREAYLDASAYMTHPSWISAEGDVFDDTRLHASLMEARILAGLGDVDAASLALQHLLSELEQIDDWQNRLSKGTYLYAAVSNTLAELLDQQGGEDREAARVREAMVNRLMPVIARVPADTRAEYDRARAVLQRERISAE